MKIVVFGTERRVGALLGDRVIDLNRASAQLPARLLNFIEAGAVALGEARRVIEKFANTALAIFKRRNFLIAIRFYYTPRRGRMPYAPTFPTSSLRTLRGTSL